MKFTINNREYESYQLTNSQVLQLYTNPALSKEEKDELNNIIVNRFTYDLCPEPGEDDDDDDVFVRFFSSFVNGKMHSKKKVAERMCNEHRYLQDQMFKVCLEYIKKLAENYGDGRYDGRNEWAAKTSSLIVEQLRKIECYI